MNKFLAVLNAAKEAADKCETTNLCNQCVGQPFCEDFREYDREDIVDIKTVERFV